MFDSTQIDKIRRNVKKYQDGEISNEKIVEQIRKPLYCCICILLMILLFCIYFAITLRTNQSWNDNKVEKFNYSSHVMELKNKFLTQLKYARQNPKDASEQRLPMPENPLFIRTKSIKLLYDYVEAATKELHKEKYDADPNYHHVECIETFTPGMRGFLKKFEEPVKEFLSNKQSIFTQQVINQYVSREKITDENNGNLKPLTGQDGVIAKETIPELSCIGHYYGDEYLLLEYEAAFSWSKYGPQQNHPYRKKWDYYMTIPYPTFGDERLDLPGNVTLTMDAYHSYNYADYVKEGGQDLTKEQSKLKENIEVFVNDARKELYQAALHPMDRVRKNCEFVYCSVDGILLTFLLTIREIKENEQLFIYYGPNYG